MPYSDITTTLQYIEKYHSRSSNVLNVSLRPKLIVLALIWAYKICKIIASGRAMVERSSSNEVKFNSFLWLNTK